MNCPEEIQVEGATSRLAARRWRQGTRPVLALHGWLDNAGSFDPVGPLLAGLDLVALDLPGHGRSGFQEGPVQPIFVDWVGEVFSAADSLGWERFSLLGHSMGAGVASLAAGTFPERITRLALVEGLGPYTSPDKEAPSLLARALTYRPSRHQRVYATRDEAVERLRSRGISFERAECLARRALVGDPENGWTFTYADQVRRPSRIRLSEGQVRAFLNAITCPTLLILGQDGMDFPDCFTGREREVADFRQVVLEGGHHLHMEHPEPVAQALLSHLLEGE